MTDRHAGYIVTLKSPVRGEGEDDATINAILQIKGVESVVPVVDDFSVQTGVHRERMRIQAALYASLGEILRPG